MMCGAHVMVLTWVWKQAATSRFNDFFIMVEDEHFISNVFVCGINGTICMMGHNAPGSMHDSQVVEYCNLYTKLQYIYNETRGKVVVDLAFKLKQNAFKPHFISKGKPN